jgi:hypothetical protein
MHHNDMTSYNKTLIKRLVVCALTTMTMVGVLMFTTSVRLDYPDTTTLPTYIIKYGWPMTYYSDAHTMQRTTGQNLHVHVNYPLNVDSYALLCLDIIVTLVAAVMASILFLAFLTKTFNYWLAITLAFVIVGFYSLVYKYNMQIHEEESIILLKLGATRECCSTKSYVPSCIAYFLWPTNYACIDNVEEIRIVGSRNKMRLTNWGVSEIKKLKSIRCIHLVGIKIDENVLANIYGTESIRRVYLEACTVYK